MGYPVETEVQTNLSEHDLMERYAYLVKRAIRHLKSQVTVAFDDQDFYQVGLMGLLEASRRYGAIDEGFKSFASQRIRGAILDELRRMDPRPRSLRISVHKMKKKLRELAMKLQRKPTGQELAEYVGMSVDEVREILESDTDNAIVSFDDFIHDRVSDADEDDRQALILSLAKIFDQLPERERLIVHLYYYEGLNMKEIGLALDLTEPRVSQIHKAILSTIKKMM